MGVLEGIIYMLWRGIAIGVVISAPMGPVGILCVQRTLEKGRRTGLLTGVGAALSDLIYCLITGFGLSLVEDFLNKNQNVIQLIGSVVLVIFGIYLFRSNPARSLRKPGEQDDAPHKHILSGFLFTFSNPLIIFLIIGLYARFNFLSQNLAFYDYIIGFMAIITGALGWWWIVTYLVNKVRAHFNLRSMWLINKIIGSVIMIFAVVGMVTAISGIASAAPREALYLNSTRGFSGRPGGEGKPLVIENREADTLFLSFDREWISGGELAFRLASLNNAAGKKYVWRDAAGKEHRISHPGWGLGFLMETDTLATGLRWEGFFIRTLDDTRDNLAATQIGITGTEGSDRIGSGLDFFTGWNAFRIVEDGEGLRFYGGNRELKELGSRRSSPSAGRREFGFFIAPGGKIALDQMTFSEGETREFPVSVSGVGNAEDVLDLMERLKRSNDPMEGIWGEFDRVLDETMISPGGNYRLLIAGYPEGYEIIYISGARQNTTFWHEGMLKGRLKSTPFNGVFDVMWTGADGNPLEEEIKAQFEAPDLLTIHFPYRDSRIRLRKIR